MDGPCVSRDFDLSFQKQVLRSWPENELKEAIKARPLESWHSPGHIGCLFSHFNLWKRISEGADDYACIMEDDVHISPVFARLVKNENFLPKDFDLIRFEYSPGRLLLSKDKVFTDTKTGVGLHKLRSSSWGAAAYVISRKCAQKMIFIPVDRHRVVDYLLFDLDESPVANDLAIYQFSPAVVIQDKDIADDNIKHHFKSNLDESYVPPTPMETWAALKKGNFSYALRTLCGYKPVPYVI